jgi:hypothetical protein
MAARIYPCGFYFPRFSYSSCFLPVNDAVNKLLLFGAGFS